MARLKHNLSCGLAALLLVTGCGRKDRGGGGGETASDYTVPDHLKNPPEVSPVPLGSRDVAPTVAPGLVRGTVLVRLRTEPGAKVSFSLRPFAADAPVAALSEYKEALHLLPPVTIWAQAEKDGQRGPVRSFSYDYDPAFLPPLAARDVQRLPRPLPEAVSLGTAPSLTRFAPLAAAERLTAAVTLDGAVADWSAQGRLAALDGTGDVPATLPSIDISWAQAGETDDAIYCVIALLAKPTTADTTIYGFDLGPSNITFGTFGAGTSFHYRAEVHKGTLSLMRRDNGQTLPLSAASTAVLGEVLEIKLARADVPLLDGVTDVVIRPYALDYALGPTVADRMEPMFLRSQFAMTKSLVTAGDTRVWELSFLSDPRYGDELLARKYLDMGQTVIPELEAMNRIRFYTAGSLSLYFVDKEENGYAGLNTSDRGMLTTIGANASPLAKAQIMAHELAHYQNARNSQLKPRWLQEGMSEWSAERYLYRHFPARAVHRFLRKLRFDRYFDSLGGLPDEFPLATWGQEASSIGYEKSLMFIDLIEAKVGQPALVKAFQQAVNESTDTDGFRTFLEAETGQDLSGLFRHWAHAGPADAGFEPASLFKDADGDDLLALDEQLLGTSPVRSDSDGDGYPDGEEYFRGMDPLKSRIDADASLTTTTLVDRLDQDTSALFRLGGAPEATHRWSFDPGSASPERPFVAPLLLRPPYTVAVQADKDDAPGPVASVTRDLYVGGVAQTVTWLADLALPLVPRTTKQLATGVTYPAASTGTVEDLAADLPDFLAAFDLKALTVATSEAGVTLTIGTRAKPSPYGDYGDYVVTFDTLTWPASGPEATRRYALTMAGGAPYWHVYEENYEGSALQNEGLSFSFGETLAVTIDASLLANWLNDDHERQVCVYSQLMLEGDNRFKDRGGCVTLSSPGFTVKTAQLADKFGLGTHTVEVFVSAASQADTRATGLATLGLSAIREFETALGRPLMDRSHWPVHVTYLAGGNTLGSAAVRTGAWLALPASMEGATLDYLFVEQLARLVMADILDKSGDVPYWLQETLIQWLTSSAMYRIHPSKDVHTFHMGRIDDYQCYVDGIPGCASFFSADVPLSGWNVTTLASTGSVRSLMFALELDALLGADVMGKALTTFVNAVPSSASLRAILKSLAPAQAATIDAMWTTWVDGSGSAGTDTATIRATLDDVDGDGLLKFEEQKLGFSDNVDNTYLD